MFLRHTVIDPHIILIFYTINENHVPLIRGLRYERSEHYSVAMDGRLSHAVDRVPANRADIELGPQHICGYIRVPDRISGDQFRYRNPECLRYRLQQSNIRISLSRKGRTVRCSVEDHGPGIAPEELDHIWERYYRSSSNTVRTAEGTGLGLSIVKEVLTLHKANFGVDSTVGVGTTFWFELDLIREEEDAANG